MWSQRWLQGGCSAQERLNYGYIVGWKESMKNTLTLMWHPTNPWACPRIRLKDCTDPCSPWSQNPTNPWAWNSTNPSVCSRIRLQISTNPKSPQKALLPLKSHVSSVSYSVRCCFSPSRQPSSWTIPCK